MYNPLPQPLPVQSGTGQPQYENGLEVPHIYRKDIPYVKDDQEAARQKAWNAAGMPPPQSLNGSNPVWNQQQKQQGDTAYTPVERVDRAGSGRKASLAEIMARNAALTGQQNDQY